MAGGRRAVADARRVVVKVGSSSLTSAAGGELDVARLTALVNALSVRRSAGTEIVLVSSGAIAAGIGPLGMETRPRDLARQQAAASVGQGVLLSAYDAAFGRHGHTIGQVLLTVDDVTRRTHYTNAKRTLDSLLDLGVIPIVNENDTVATDEIRFGDNDRLAALVAHLVRADALVLLTDVDALYTAAPGTAGAERVPVVGDAAELAEISIGGTGSAVGSGGMTTKVEAATIAGAAGIPTVLTSSDRVVDALAGADVGTWFVPQERSRGSRALWLAHATTPRGSVQIDAGAVTALRDRGRSLLPAGITGVSGSFVDGDPVDVIGPDGVVIARGLVNYTSGELPHLMGRSTKDLEQEIGPRYEREVIHRDHLALL
ncbi:glutamate 5-kinase [Janibacter terrae]|uniref:Glutamate 5-kinase n=1 Tax=Janibacter terrae TaxID=103817 RepID=A0ABZ2FDJ3_9MICO|nr:glutamate 5-kinase [Janibacter terrae]MBA4083564.1 glutamate 5-kinase [Kytococcus sp.]HBO53888.1 glutamate 5-kinase [Janibacter terrae]